MYKSTNEITNKGLEFKLINSMSFGESMISTGCIQKTIKGDLHVRGNQRIPPLELHGKTLEDSRRLSTEAGMRHCHVGSAGTTCRLPHPLAHLSASPLLHWFPTAS
jgi:hypothetical protein